MVSIFTLYSVGESVQTSVEHSAATSTLNMKCKLMKSNRVVSFCRFVRLNDDVGYNLEAGRGEGRYRYNGDGFAHQECGISITNPDDNDKSPWKCLIGVENNETMGAIVDGSDPKQPYGQGTFFSIKQPICTRLSFRTQNVKKS